MSCILSELTAERFFARQKSAKASAMRAQFEGFWFTKSVGAVLARKTQPAAVFRTAGRVFIHGGVMVSTGEGWGKKASRGSISPQNGGKFLNAKNDLALAA